jgi:PAS domain S-box-containing protein
MRNARSPVDLLDVHDLTLSLQEAQEMLRAIRRGEVDAFIVKPDEQERVLTLAGADQIYRALFETLNEGALTLGPDARICSANSRFADLVGLPINAVIGAPLLPLIAPEDQPHFACLIETARHGDSKAEMTLLRADGTRATVMLSLCAVPLAGSDRLLTAVVTDLTELRQAQEALQLANAGLEARVAERTAALTVADRRKDEFLAMLAHELRNPLSALSNALHLLQQRSADPPLERLREIMERQVQQLTRLAGELLDLSQISQGKMMVIPYRVDLARLAREAAEDARGMVEEAGLTLSVELPPQPVWVEGDPHRLTQVIANLLRNAVKFTDPGGEVGVQVFRGSGVQAFGVDNNGPVLDLAGPERPNARTPEPLNAVLTVTDTGIGIEPELLPHLFDLFRQAEESRGRSRDGLGLGLALVKGLVELHGGTVAAHSEGPGRGAVFTVRLPLAGGDQEGGGVHQKMEGENQSGAG